MNGRSPDQQLERGDGERVAVAGRGRGLAERALGGEVGGGAEHLAGAGERVLGPELRDPEVGDVQHPIAVEQEVGELDVAVDHAAAVGVVERRGGLLQPPEARSLVAPSRPASASATVPPERYSITMNGRPVGLSSVGAAWPTS